MAVLATPIFLIDCCEPGRWDGRTNARAPMMEGRIEVRLPCGLTSVAMLGRIDLDRGEEAFVDRSTSVRMKRLENLG